MIQVIKEDFTRFEWYVGNNWSKTYSTVELIPSICLVVDNQMNETWKYENDEGIYVINPSIITTSIIFNWLGFYIDVTINFKTHKPVRDEVGD